MRLGMGVSIQLYVIVHIEKYRYACSYTKLCHVNHSSAALLFML